MEHSNFHETLFNYFNSKLNDVSSRCNSERSNEYWFQNEVLLAFDNKTIDGFKYTFLGSRFYNSEKLNDMSDGDWKKFIDKYPIVTEEGKVYRKKKEEGEDDQVVKEEEFDPKKSVDFVLHNKETTILSELKVLWIDKPLTLDFLKTYFDGKKGIKKDAVRLKHHHHVEYNKSQQFLTFMCTNSVEPTHKIKDVKELFAESINHFFSKEDKEDEKVCCNIDKIIITPFNDNDQRHREMRYRLGFGDYKNHISLITIEL